MFTFLTNASERLVAQMHHDIGATFMVTSRVAEDLTAVTMKENEVALVTAALRSRGYWLDRVAGRPPRGGTRGSRDSFHVQPLIAMVQPVMAGVASHVIGHDVSPEMDSLMRKVSRR